MGDIIRLKSASFDRNPVASTASSRKMRSLSVTLFLLVCGIAMAMACENFYSDVTCESNAKCNRSFWKGVCRKTCNQCNVCKNQYALICLRRNCKYEVFREAYC